MSEANPADLSGASACWFTRSPAGIPDHLSSQTVECTELKAEPLHHSVQHPEHPSAGVLDSTACGSERAPDATPGMELRTSDDDASLLSGASPRTLPDIEVSEDILRHQTLALMDLLDQEPDAHLAVLSTVTRAAGVLSCTSSRRTRHLEQCPSRHAQDDRILRP